MTERLQSTAKVSALHRHYLTCTVSMEDSECVSGGVRAPILCLHELRCLDPVALTSVLLLQLQIQSLHPQPGHPFASNLASLLIVEWRALEFLCNTVSLRPPFSPV